MYNGDREAGSKGKCVGLTDRLSVMTARKEPQTEVASARQSRQEWLGRWLSLGRACLPPCTHEDLNLSHPHSPKKLSIETHV